MAEAAKVAPIMSPTCGNSKSGKCGVSGECNVARFGPPEWVSDRAGDRAGVSEKSVIAGRIGMGFHDNVSSDRHQVF
ncbi:hypothetical protein [Frondihabitans sp. PAMC 28766]|uniref:hypothetical protein n=1 Tax=Frondihabitans sp. PAMC 28766 TaxID=1795630 RepID=UPI00138F91C8|nr:hypothetical protein [Frondihabitans sp. PAMC 28766]